MPIYEYACEACQSRFEALVPYIERDEVVCECCGEARAQRLASVFASSLEGSTTGSSVASGPACCGGSCHCCGE